MNERHIPELGEKRETAMPPGTQLRPALPNDFAFCKALYLSYIRPLLEALDAWDAEKADNAFKGYFKTEEIRIIQVDDIEAGWIQVSETDGEVHLDQLHLLETFRGKGIGTQLICETMAQARSVGKPLLLSFLRGNRAASLYDRLGFRPNGSDRTKVHMRWDEDLMI